MTILKHPLSLFALLLVCAAFAGCNTVEGMGKDIQSGGEAVEDAAN